jgi:hypothetical protein
MPPLGGRLFDGTKSIFISRPTSSPRPSPLGGPSSIPGPSSAGGLIDPLRSTNYSAVSSPLRDPLGQGSVPSLSRVQEVDPLASVKPHQMASSLRVQPTRPRLDPREAASKLAKMF